MRVARSSRARASCVTGCLVRLMIVLLLIGLAALVIFTVILVREEQITPEIVDGLPDAASDARAAFGQASVVPPGDERPGGLLVFTTRGDASNFVLSYLDGDPLALLWESDKLDMSDESAPLPPAIGDETVYLAEGTRLHALDLTDGERRWSAELSAAIPPGCASCIQPLAGAVAVLTEDQTLQVLSADDGEPLWQTALNTLPRELYLLEGSPAAIDTLPESDSSALIVFDALSGVERKRFEPRCTPDGVAETLNPGSPVLVDPASGAIYFLFGFTQHGCAQRWDLTTGEMVWSASFPLQTSGWPRSWMTVAPLLGDDAIYLAGAEGAAILALDTADGTLRTLVRSTSHTLKPWALAGGTLLVRAEQLDSLDEDELWGIALPDGEQLWDYPIKRDNSSWTAHRAPGGFVVIQLVPDPPRLRVTLLDTLDGAPLRERVLAASAAAWTGTTWSDDTAWLTIGALYRVDLDTGRPYEVWPPR